MGFWNGNSKKTTLKLTSADLTGALKSLTEQGIILFDIVYENDLTAYVTVKREHHKQLLKILQKRGDEGDLTDKFSVYGLLHRLKRRFILVAGVLVLLILTVYIPSRIFFIQVKGNQKIPSEYIAEIAMQNGITFGCSRWDIRSSQLKNRMLQDVPELDWVGVTTAGCVATIEVKEKEIPDTQSRKNFCSIVASADGVVESVTVTKGKALCVPGQAVRAEQLLISGYADHGLLLKATGAEGEVIAKTLRTVEAVTPTCYALRGEKMKTSVDYSVQIGKKVINFTKDSSISHAGCVKMYTRKYMTLPGGYILPVAFIRQESVYYETHQNTVDDYAWLDQLSKEYLLSQMLAGEIIESTSQCTRHDDVYGYSGTFVCREQIGKYIFEENPLDYGKNS